MVLSYDEKPGIQTIENTAPDLSQVPGQLRFSGDATDLYVLSTKNDRNPLEPSGGIV